MKYQLLVCVLLSCSVQVFGKQELVTCDSEFLMTCADNAQCAYKDFVCDGDNDCDDGSDEKNCENHKCPTDAKKCADNKQCVLKDWFCDGYPDCPDESDERTCENFSCTGWFKECADKKQCIFTDHFCNGRKDCNDASDEANCPSICELDLSIVMDGSDSKQKDFNKQKEFVKILVDQFTIGPKSTRIAISSFGTNAQSEYLSTGFGLSDGTSKQKVLNTLENIQPVGGKAFLGKALERQMQNTFKGSSARKVLLVLTDGKSDDPSRTTEQLDLLHKTHIETGVVVLPGADWDLLNSIPSNEDLIGDMSDMQSAEIIRGFLGEFHLPC